MPGDVTSSPRRARALISRCPAGCCSPLSNRHHPPPMSTFKDKHPFGTLNALSPWLPRALCISSWLHGGSLHASWPCPRATVCGTVASRQPPERARAWPDMHADTFRLGIPLGRFIFPHLSVVSLSKSAIGIRWFVFGMHYGRLQTNAQPKRSAFERSTRIAFPSSARKPIAQTSPQSTRKSISCPAI